MTTTLAPEVVQRYESEGYISPIRVLGNTDVARFRSAYDAYEQGLAEQVATLAARDRYVYFAETHTYLPWAYELARAPAILDAVESLIGPDLLIWDSRWFTKQPGDPTYISWHQDGTYWQLSPAKVCTAWIALSRSYTGNGAMQVVPASHVGGQLPHIDTFDEANALARGQEIAHDVDESSAVTLTLDAGEMSIHHIGVVHGSKPNTSDEPRIGFAVRFIAAEVKQAVADPIAMLVRGSDRYGNFELLEAAATSAPDEIETKRREIIQRMYSNLLPDEEPDDGR